MENEIEQAKKRPTILVVDDEPVTRKIVLKALEALGYETLSAENGFAGLDIARDKMPDLVLTDALMPRMDGRELCRLIKADPITKSIKVIVTTGIYTKQRDRNEAYREFGVDDYLNKPFTPEELKEVLAKHLSFDVEVNVS